jgi:hypothetical protein
VSISIYHRERVRLFIKTTRRTLFAQFLSYIRLNAKWFISETDISISSDKKILGAMMMTRKKSSVLACYSTFTGATKFARREAKRISRRAEDDSFEYPDPPDEGYDPYYCAEIMLRNEHPAIETAYIKVEKVRCRTAFHPEDFSGASDFATDDDDDDDSDEESSGDSPSEDSSSEDSDNESLPSPAPSSRATTVSTPSAVNHSSPASGPVSQLASRSINLAGNSDCYSVNYITYPSTIVSSNQWSSNGQLPPLSLYTMPITYSIPMSFDAAAAATFRDRSHKAMEMFRTHELPRQDFHLAKTSGTGQQQDQRSTAETPNERSTNTALRRNRNSEATGAEDEDESRGNDSGRRVRQKTSDDDILSIDDLIS